MKILITGTSQGIGKAIAQHFLNEAHQVIGIDRKEASISHKNYAHYKCDICDYDNLPDIKNVNILINKSGTAANNFQEAYYEKTGNYRMRWHEYQP